MTWCEFSAAPHPGVLFVVKLVSAVCLLWGYSSSAFAFPSVTLCVCRTLVTPHTACLSFRHESIMRTGFPDKVNTRIYKVHRFNRTKLSIGNLIYSLFIPVLQETHLRPLVSSQQLRLMVFAACPTSVSIIHSLMTQMTLWSRVIDRDFSKPYSICTFNVTSASEAPPTTQCSCQYCRAAVPKLLAQMTSNEHEFSATPNLDHTIAPL